MLFFLSCRPYDTGDDGLKWIHVEQSVSFGDRPDSYILSAYGIAVLPDGSLVIADKLDYKLKKFNKKGRKILEAGKRGDRPGEFRGPSAVSANDSLIAVADFASSRVQIFTSDLKYKATFRAPGPVVDANFDPTGRLWLGILTDPLSANVLCVDSSGAVIQSIRLKHTSDDFFENMFSFVIDGLGNIIVVFNFQNKVEIWDISGKLRNEFTLPGFPPKPGKKKLSKGLFTKGIEVPEDNIFKSVAVDPADNIYVLAGEYSLSPNRDIFVLDRQGQLTAMILIPHNSAEILVGPNYELYSIEQERTLVRSYRLKK